jgi:CRP-like cAMP-binding protein
VEIVLTPKRTQSCVVARFKRGQYFGEIELVRGGKSIATARAGLKNPVKLAILRKQDFRQLLKKSVKTKKEIEKTIISRLKEHQTASEREINVC